MGRARRAFVIVWLLFTVAGAVNHTLLDRRLDLWLPHLKYGHVMFNHNPHTAQLFYYSGADGVRHDLANLLETPAPGYRRARLAISVATQPDYLAELCLRARKAGRGDLTFTIQEVDLDSRQTTSHDGHCDAHGLH